MITTGPQFDNVMAELELLTDIELAEQTEMPARTAFADLIPMPRIDPAAIKTAKPAAMSLLLQVMVAPWSRNSRRWGAIARNLCDLRACRNAKKMTACASKRPKSVGRKLDK